MIESPRLHIVHLNNDYTGSTRVLSQCASVLNDNFDELFIYTNLGDGLLSNHQFSKAINIPYSYHNNILVRLLYFLYAQIRLFLGLCKNLKVGDLVLINTSLPFSAALAAKCKGCKCVYYLHEDKVGSKLLTIFLFFMIKRFSCGVIYVSYYLI